MSRLSNLSFILFQVELKSPSLKNLVALFLNDKWAGPEAPSLSAVGAEHLITLIFGQSIQHQHDQS
jgi:hypothetical protein